MYRPRSISRLVLIGFAVVLAPMIVATVTAVVQVGGLAQVNRDAVLRSREATEQSRALVGQLTEMQRALGQYEVRGDSDFYGIYLERRADFRAALTELRALSLMGLDNARLEALEAEEQRLFDSLGRERGMLQHGSAWEDAGRALAAFAEIAREVQVESNRLIEIQADDAIANAEEVQRTLLVFSIVTILTAVALATVFVALINRPLRDLGRAISNLGSRRLEAPISVHGPRDVESLGRQLDWLRRRLQELEGQKTKFLQHISHELKTPLTTIREGAELLAEDLSRDSAEQAEIVGLMRSNSLYLQKLIEDLLQFARTQDPSSELEAGTHVDLKVMISDLIRTHSVAIGAKDIEINQSLGAAGVWGDEKKLRILVDNLLTNAVKYTPVNGVVHVSLASRDGRAVIDVMDSGPGIEEAEKESIFEPFRQGSAQSFSSVKGTGLGLSIAKEYAEAHHGFIEAVPSVAGAHFQVVLPLDGPNALADA